MAAAIVAAGCGSAPKRQPYYSDDGPPQAIPDGLERLPDAVPRDEAFNRFANRPYTVFGETYVPAVDKEPFRQRGLASWYGRKFHGQKTASGEPYDMFKMTAAHKTLPIPSYAKVTNLANGKSVVVRINDRGPFHSNRIIDLSYAAASRIGIAAKGSAMVEVERVFAPPAAQAAPPEAASPVAATPASAASASASDAAPAAAGIRTPLVTQEPAGIWVQLGAFSSAEGAESFREKARRELPWILEPVQIVQSGGLNRVRLGPYRNRDEAEAIAAKVRQSLGYAPSIIER
jgi:rare lipoprotein A